VQLERQVVLDREFDPSSPTPVAEAQTYWLFDFIGSIQNLPERGRGLVLRSLFPEKRARVGVLRLHGDGSSTMPSEDPADGLVEGREVSHDDSGLVRERVELDVAAAEVCPGKIREEEFGARRVHVAFPPKVVDLHVIEAGDISKEAKALTWTAKDRELRLGRFDSVWSQLWYSVDMLRDEPHGIAVAGELRCLPGLAHPLEALAQPTRARIQQALDRERIGSGDKQVMGRVVSEELHENIGSLVDPRMFWPQVLVRVDKREGLDVKCEIASRERSLGSGTVDPELPQTDERSGGGNP
jgi:hypothetical protein